MISNKYTKKQIIEAIEHWTKKLNSMNESLENMSKEQLKQKGTQAGKEIAKQLNYKLIDKCVAKNGEHLGDDLIKEIIFGIPSNVKEQIFGFLTQDVIDEFLKSIEDGNGNENLQNTFRHKERNAFLEDLLETLIFDSTCAEWYEDEGFAWNSYNSYMDFDDELAVDGGIIDKVCTFCENFCIEYSKEFIKMMNSSNVKKKFKVITQWFVPEMREEVIEARDEDEADEILAEKYKQYMNSHSEGQELYNGIHSIEEM